MGETQIQTKEITNKYCGQKFWEFVSGEINLYTELIEPLGHKAKERNDDFIKSYSQRLNKFTKEFTTDFCDKNGAITWDKLVKLNSAIFPIETKKYATMFNSKLH